MEEVLACAMRSTRSPSVTGLYLHSCFTEHGLSPMLKIRHSKSSGEGFIAETCLRGVGLCWFWGDSILQCFYRKQGVRSEGLECAHEIWGALVRGVQIGVSASGSRSGRMRFMESLRGLHE